MPSNVEDPGRMSDVVRSNSSLLLNTIPRPRFPAYKVLLRPETSDLDEKDIQARRQRLFETESNRCWIDIYTPPKHQVQGNGSSPPCSGGEDTDVGYLGRCDVPFQRVRNTQQHTDAIDYAISNTVMVADGVKLRPMLFYIVRQTHSWSRLLTDEELLEIALGSIDTSNPTLPNILGFGWKCEDTEIGGPPFWYKPPVAWATNDHTHTQHHYNCGYTLKYMEPNRRAEEQIDRPWSERQSCIVFSGERQTWALISPSTRMQIRMAEYCETLEPGQECNTFVLHLLFVGAAMSNWRPYLAYLTHEINEQINRIVATNQDTIEDKDGSFDLLKVTDRQRVRLIEDRVSDMFAMLDATLSVLTSLQEKYHVFLLGHDGVKKGIMRDDMLAYMLQEKIREVEFVRRQLQALHDRVKSGVQLLSSLLDLGNGLSLQKLAKESSRENEMMRKLSEKATADASAVKVITIITLIYLPTSVATNFFSTTFVNSEQTDRGTEVTVANNWWLLAAVAAPLTLVTCTIWLLLQNRIKCTEVMRLLAKNTSIKITQRFSSHKTEKLATDEEQRSTC